nr:zinc finger, CCHC-type [Tanacetum cinerariifolium]
HIDSSVEQRGHILGVGRVLAGQVMDVLMSPDPRCTHTTDFNEVKKQTAKERDRYADKGGEEERQDVPAAYAASVTCGPVDVARECISLELFPESIPRRHVAREVYLANPGKNHWEAVKWILKYLRGTANVGLIYETNRGNHKDVTGFVDSDYAKDPDKGRGGVYGSYGGCEESYLAKGTLGRVREVLEAKTVEVLKVGTEHNAADALTNVVPGYKLQHCLELLSVGTGSMQVLHGFEFEVKLLGDHTFKMMDARSNVYGSNGYRKSSDDNNDYYWKYALAKGNVLGMDIARDQSGNLRVSQSMFYNQKVSTDFNLLEGHSILSLEGSLSRDCDVKENGSLKANLQHMEALLTTEAEYMMFTEA